MSHGQVCVETDVSMAQGNPGAHDCLSTVLHGVRHAVCHDCGLCRKMTFGKVNELGQFIGEAEPEPDVKKSKGRRR